MTPRLHDDPEGIRKAYLGIDPGKAGGIAFYAQGGMGAVPMPTTERDIWETMEVGAHLWNTQISQVMACIEKVHSMPKQGITSSFTFGMGYGGLRMALIAAGIPFDEVAPQAWQKALGIPPRKKTESKSQFKNRLKAKAQQLFPGIDVTLATADAILIAEYCRRKYEGLLR